MANDISGTYTTKRDGGLTYTYYADWHETEQGVAWNSKVRKDGQLAGTPNGVIYETHNIAYAELVQALVENSIEKRVAID